MEKVARICYNENGWTHPSGRKEKAVNPDSYEHLHGFGHEEWLFDFSKLIKGYHYGFIQPLNGYYHAGKTYDIHLFFYTKRTGKVYIGCIHNAECIDKRESDKVYSIYEKKKWLKEMTNQVLAVNAEPVSMEDIFNVRFRPSDVEVNLSNPKLISPDDPNTQGLYYKLMEKRSDFIFVDSHIRYSKKRKGVERKSEDIVKGGIYEKTEYNPLHNEIQNKVIDILKASGEFVSVIAEEDYVDIKAQKESGQIYFFEIKTDPAKMSIREALGQIIEYSDYPDNSRADKLIIISMMPLDAQDELYIQHLRNRYNIPLWYRCYSFATNTLGIEQ